MLICLSCDCHVTVGPSLSSYPTTCSGSSSSTSSSTPAWTLWGSSWGLQTESSMETGGKNLYHWVDDTLGTWRCSLFRGVPISVTPVPSVVYREVSFILRVLFERFVRECKFLSLGQGLKSHNIENEIMVRQNTHTQIHMTWHESRTLHVCSNMATETRLLVSLSMT